DECGVSPRPSAAPARSRVPRARFLPFLLGGQPSSGPRGVGLGFEVAHVLDGLVRRNFLRVTEAAPTAVRRPEQRPGQIVFDPMGPAPGRPPVGAVVAAVDDERFPLGIGDRYPPDTERRKLDHGGRTLVVEGPGLIAGVDTQDEFAGRDQYRVMRYRARLRQRAAAAEQR